MLILNQELASNRGKLSGRDYTRRKLQHAQAGNLSLADLEKCGLDKAEVARFLTQQIPLLRAASNGAKFELLTLLFDELYFALVPKAERAIAPSLDRVRESV
jgi:hypothetical protein